MCFAALVCVMFLKLREVGADRVVPGLEVWREKLACEEELPAGVALAAALQLDQMLALRDGVHDQILAAQTVDLSSFQATPDNL